ncbi:MAG: histidine phosphotransferase family protein [Pseudomonadota bacterium]
MQTQNASLAALIGSRICHDLISPLGAISNGLELMSMSGIASTEEFGLVAESVASANARIRLFRIVFGAASTGQSLKSAEIDQILQDVYADSKLQVAPFPVGDFERVNIQAVLLALLCVEQAIPFGGALSVEHSNGTWTIKGSGDRIKIDETLWGRLRGASMSDMPSPASVQFAVLPDLAASNGFEIHAQSTHDDATITLKT